METKAFEFWLDVRGGVRLVEKSRGVSQMVTMALPTVFWLLLSWIT